MRQIFKNVKQKLVSKYIKNSATKNTKEVLQTVKEQLVSKYTKNDNTKSSKKFKPRIKARIRRNKQIISKNIDNLFDWIKGAEIVELKKCNTSEDPVRPELDNKFRTSYGRKKNLIRKRN